MSDAGDDIWTPTRPLLTQELVLLRSFVETLADEILLSLRACKLDGPVLGISLEDNSYEDSLLPNGVYVGTANGIRALVEKEADARIGWHATSGWKGEEFTIDEQLDKGFPDAEREVYRMLLAAGSVWPSRYVLIEVASEVRRRIDEAHLVLADYFVVYVNDEASDLSFESMRIINPVSALIGLRKSGLLPSDA